MSSKKVINNQSANSTAFSDITSFEDLMSLDNPIKSTTVTRWERKARQQQVTCKYYNFYIVGNKKSKCNISSKLTATFPADRE